MPAAHILVTGGAGFIGSHTVDRLVAGGASVTVLDDFSSGREANLVGAQTTGQVRLMRGDVRRQKDVAQAMKGCTAVVHLAAISSVSASVEDPALVMDINTVGTAHVLKEAQRAGVPRVVFASSAAVYGDPDALPIAEQAALRPLSPYAASKVAGEMLCRAAAATGGQTSVALRFFNVYGPRQDPKSPYCGVITAFAGRLQAHEPLVVHGQGDQVRDFVHVSDVARAVGLALKTPLEGFASLNIGSGQGVTVKELAERMAALGEGPPGVVQGPPRAGDVKASLADISRAAQQLGFRPSVSLEEGLAAFLQPSPVTP